MMTLTHPPPNSNLTLLEERHTNPLLESGETLPYDVWRRNPDRACLRGLTTDDHCLVTQTDYYAMAVNRLISNGLTPGGVVTLLHQGSPELCRRANHSVLAWRFELFLRTLRASRDALYVAQMAPSTPGITGLSASKAHKWTSQAYKAQRAAVERMAVDNETDLIVPILKQLGQYSLARQVETDLNTITLILEERSL